MQVWTFTASTAHLRTCLEISLEGKGPVLGQLYDELCRSSWSEKALRGSSLFLISGMHVCVACALARAGDHGFSVTTESERKDLEVLERARRQLDLTRPAQAAKGGGKGKPSGLCACRLLCALTALHVRPFLTSGGTQHHWGGQQQQPQRQQQKKRV